MLGQYEQEPPNPGNTDPVFKYQSKENIERLIIAYIVYCIHFVGVMDAMYELEMITNNKNIRNHTIVDVLIVSPI